MEMETATEAPNENVSKTFSHSPKATTAIELPKATHICVRWKKSG